MDNQFNKSRNRDQFKNKFNNKQFNPFFKGEGFDVETGSPEINDNPVLGAKVGTINRKKDIADELEKS